jgi:FG-GAP-like repeat/PASTA domain
MAATLAPGGAARTAAGPALSFAAAKTYAIGTSPCSIATGELNGDGKPDVVTANCDTTKVSVLLNRGDGAFEGRRDYAAGARPQRVEIADMNGDGKSDVVTTNLDRTFSVLLNEGAGTLEPGATHSLGLGPRDSLYELLVVDLNGDDKRDVVSRTAKGEADTSVSVLLNRGDGTFEPRRDYLSARYIQDVAVGDLNGDANPDLVAVREDAFSVLINAGDGTFEASRDDQGTFAWKVAIGDLNGDGKPDLATANATVGLVSVRLNRGDGTFERPDTYDCRLCNTPAPEAIAITDVNADGRADLVTAWDDVRYHGIHEGTEYLTYVAVLLNKGTRRFSSPRSYEISGSAWLAIVDLSGDGKPDVAAADEASTLAVLLNKGTGRFEPSLSYRFGYDGHAVASADLNGDGRQDFAAALAGKRHAVAVRLNTPGLCNVQSVRGTTVAAAKRKLGRANCRAGKVTRAYEKRVGKGRVISQRPRFGAVLPGGAKVNLVVSRGKRR